MQLQSVKRVRNMKRTYSQINFFVVKYLRFQFIFHLKTRTHPGKSHSFFLKTLSKIEILSNHLFLKNWLEAQSPSRKGARYVISEIYEQIHVILILATYCSNYVKKPQDYYSSLFFNCYLAVPQPILGHYQGDSFTNSMLITAFVQVCNEVGSLRMVERQVGFELGTFRF